MAADFGSDSEAQLFLLSAEVVFAVVAAFCSSPQTAEINADKRAATLMKWVYIGLGTSVLFVSVAVYLDKKRWPSILGGSLAGSSLGIAYAYAKHSGLKNPGEGTEN